MKTYDKNIDYFNKLEPDFGKTEEQLWADIEQRTNSAPLSKRIRITRIRYSVAAAILLLIGLAVFMRFYTQNIATISGEHLSHTLPDGSVIELNAVTSISYHPYWWPFERNLDFSGEAFFKVNKGEEFTVISNEGQTTILGTSFNIFARETDYRVYCKSGRIKVASTRYDIEYELTAGELAVIDNPNKAGRKIKTEDKTHLSWTKGSMSFTDASLERVFEEIERQYNIEIESSKDIDELIFGAYFDKPENPEEVLDLICIQFNLEYKKTEENKYRFYMK